MRPTPAYDKALDALCRLFPRARAERMLMAAVDERRRHRAADTEKRRRQENKILRRGRWIEYNIWPEFVLHPDLIPSPQPWEK